MINPRLVFFREFSVLKSICGCFCGDVQKQSPDVFCKKRCSQKFCKIHRKTPVSESLFLIKLQASASGRLWHKCFPVNFAKFLRTRFLQSTSRRLLLIVGFNAIKLLIINSLLNFCKRSFRFSQQPNPLKWSSIFRRKPLKWSNSNNSPAVADELFECV